VRYYAERVKKEGKEKLSEVLFDILATPISPELLPPDENGRITQKTEDLVGPYEIHDFYIYYTLRYGMSPDKLFRIARYALGDKYSDAELLRWLESFARRFFSQQFKRSCMPDGPAVFDVSLSPRAAWKMPSDACGRAWLDIIKELK
jgi:NAD+ synthase (glutamine-hydrolysing)